MTLTFPTMAEQALAEFRSSTKTTSIATIAKRMGATVEKEAWTGKRIYHFDDDTTLEAKGAGRGLQAETFLP